MEVNKQLNVPQHENTLCCCQGQTRPIVVWVDISSGGARHSLSRIANFECLAKSIDGDLNCEHTISVLSLQFRDDIIVQYCGALKRPLHLIII